jgi:hypothetical protein
MFVASSYEFLGRLAVQADEGNKALVALHNEGLCFADLGSEILRLNQLLKQNRISWGSKGFFGMKYHICPVGGHPLGVL